MEYIRGNAILKNSWSLIQTKLHSFEIVKEAFLMAQSVKTEQCGAGDLGLIPRSGRSPGEGNGKPLQYPCLENLMDRGAWWAAVHGPQSGA